MRTAVVARIHLTSELIGSAHPTPAVYGTHAMNSTDHSDRLTIVSARTASLH